MELMASDGQDQDGWHASPRQPIVCHTAQSQNRKSSLWKPLGDGTFRLWNCCSVLEHQRNNVRLIDFVSLRPSVKPRAFTQPLTPQSFIKLFFPLFWLISHLFSCTSDCSLCVSISLKQSQRHHSGEKKNLLITKKKKFRNNKSAFQISWPLTSGPVLFVEWVMDPLLLICVCRRSQWN